MSPQSPGVTKVSVVWHLFKVTEVLYPDTFPKNLQYYPHLSNQEIQLFLLKRSEIVGG